MKTQSQIEAMITREITALKKDRERFFDQSDIVDELDHKMSALEGILAKIRRKDKHPEVLSIRIVDFTKDKDEPAYDVECYIDGKFDNTHDGVFSTRIYDKGKSEGHKEALKKLALMKAFEHAIEKVRYNQINIK